MADNARQVIFDDQNVVTKDNLDKELNNRIEVLSALNEKNFSDGADISGDKLADGTITKQYLKLKPVSSVASVATTLTSSFQAISGASINVTVPTRTLCMIIGVFDINMVLADGEFNGCIRDNTNSTSTVNAFVRHLNGNGVRMSVGGTGSRRETKMLTTFYTIEAGTTQFQLYAKTANSGTASLGIAHTKILALPFTTVEYQ